MDNCKFIKARLIISHLIKNIPLVYLNNIYNEMIAKDKFKYTGEEKEMLSFLKKYYYSNNSNYESQNIIFEKDDINEKEFNIFRNYLCQNIENICFDASIGSYNTQMEEEISVRKKDIMSLNNQKILYRCYFDLNKYNKIRDSNFEKINKCFIYTKLKKYPSNLPQNFRFIFSHHPVYKILDKLLTLELIDKMDKENKSINRNIFVNSYDRKYTNSIREQSYKILNLKNLVIMDIKSAFPNVTLITLKHLLKRNLTKKFGNSYSETFLTKYLFMLKNRKSYYNKNLIDIKKGISTGLPSSTIIFMLLLEEIANELIEILNKNNIKYKIDYDLNIFVDDIAFIILNKKFTKIIIYKFINMLNYYGFVINKKKCKISPDLELDIFNKIKSGDYYLGLPFSSKPKEYLDFCLKEFQERHIDINYEDIKKIIKLDKLKVYNKSSLIVNKIRGFFQYKLHGLKKYNLDNSFENIINLIDKYY